MENASKALLIAAGIMIGLIVITMVIYAHGQISSYYASKEQTIASEQLAEFNKQFIGYNRDDVRGSNIISLVNKIIDYNVEDMNYSNEQKIEISIIIPNNDKAKLFYYNYSKYYDGTARTKLIQFGENKKYTHEGSSSINTRLIAPATAIEVSYRQEWATKLASKMSTIMGENSRQTPEQLFTELKFDYESHGGITQVQEDILIYYQYLQFKRAHFDCKDLTYENGRVKSFTFEFNGTFE